MSHNYLVTGAAGFIGAAVAEKLILAGNEVTTIDNLSTGYIEHIPNGVTFIEGNTFDKTSIDKLKYQKFDAIIHIAGQSSGEISFENPVYDLQTNCQSTLMLLEYAKESGCDKFIYASTMSVYGDHVPYECTEDTELIPNSFYAVGKLASEHYMRIYSNQYGLACTALRLFNTYGEGQNLNNLKQGMVSIYLAMALKEGKIVVKGSKDRFRDFIFIDDVVDAFLKALDRKCGYDVFNVCTGKPTTVEDVINSLLLQLDTKVDVQYIEGTPGDQFGIYGNFEKISESLDWKARTSFDEGIKSMVKWAKNS